jgi:hypothetical protein
MIAAPETNWVLHQKSVQERHLPYLYSKDISQLQQNDQEQGHTSET